MAQIPEELLASFLEILPQLLLIANESSSVEYEILQRFNETEMTTDALETLTDIRQEVSDRYSQLTNAMLRIASIQPRATDDSLTIISNRIVNIQNRIPAILRSIEEITNDWRLS
ncbi:hypothetical protein DSM106972_004350 [Dulcicalothrix desertica PCC 7102]|jgi:hypothetical protein|uniref:Uncharacterized protein n=1 Tax=Dulcicalothrix desertica PCC 7102 TaxID=232991 RepID=A0A433VV31_9CYAN|nr:hypothetical protein [Dulcicalothrix desertica]MBW4601572.1 hypothetical protein [Calothrix sp. FI2-JRJ7]RUT09940.1 hypothetical protein DSM106972_004350 [Dulcicalothrix desertica PCC 7102]TWH51132.1 hypothetical protein CAL7102_05508 [Dulcicalothrix desertica PCC 7102]